MPFVHVRALPLEGDFDPGAVVRAISAEIAQAAGVDEKHMTVTWHTFAPDHYASSGITAPTQPPASHPVLVELVAPDFIPPEQVEKLLRATAAAVARCARVSPENVFVEFRGARSGQVLDAGEIVRWPG